MISKIPADTDSYIASFPPATQKLLKQLRRTIKKAAPKAIETISYSMPAYKYEGPLVYFAAYKNHIGFYPGGSPLTSLKSRLTAYKTSKGTIQFPLDQPLPLDLIETIVKMRVEENEGRKRK